MTMLHVICRVEICRKINSAYRKNESLKYVNLQLVSLINEMTEMQLFMSDLISSNGGAAVAVVP